MRDTLSEKEITTINKEGDSLHKLSALAFQPWSTVGYEVPEGDLTMRLSTKLGASVATAALGAAVVLGGAGVAQAQSSDSLGSSGPAPVVLTVEGDKDSASGTITNNTAAEVNCEVFTSNAELIAAIEDDFSPTVTVVQAAQMNATAYNAAQTAGQNANIDDIAVGPNATAPWSAPGINATADYRAGAVVQCGTNVAFAYESGGLFGSLDMGSLGS